MSSSSGQPAPMSRMQSVFTRTVDYRTKRMPARVVRSCRTRTTSCVPHAGDLLEELGAAAGVEQVAPRLAGDVAADVLADRRRTASRPRPCRSSRSSGPRPRRSTSIDVVALRRGAWTSVVGDEVDLVAVVAGVVAGRGVGAAGEEEVGEAVRSGGRGRSSGRRPSGRRGPGRRGPGCPCAAWRRCRSRSPVAHTMTSNSRTPSVVSMPVSVTRTIGVSRRSTSDTFGSVERLEVAGDERRALLAVAVVLRDQLLGRRRVVDDGPDLVGDELAPLGVGRGVVEDVDVVARELP